MSEADRLVEEVARALIIAKEGEESANAALSKTEHSPDCIKSTQMCWRCYADECRGEARAALSVALEAAAKVAEHGVTWTPSLSEANTRVSRETSYLLGKAIRALLPR